MKIKRIVIALFALIVAAVLVLPGKTLAATNTFSMGLTPSTGGNERVPLGGTFEVSVSIKQIDVDGGLSGVSAVLDYNSDIIEPDGTENGKNAVSGKNGWAPTFNPDNGKIVFDSAETVDKETEIAVIKFKVKKNTEAKIATVRLKNIEGANSSESMTDTATAQAVSTNVQIGEGNPSSSAEPSVKPSESARPSQSVTPSSSSRPSASSLPGTTGEDKTQPPSNPPTTRSEEDIPKSGSEDYIIPLMIAIAALGLISFVNYKRID